jgi:outer membrane receptor protein involved in Fe transport
MTVSINRAPATRSFNVAAAVAAVLAAASVQAAETTAVPADTALEEVMVFGRGQSRQVSEISAIEIQQAAPGSSALKIISKLPGVSFQSADPYGAYEWSTRITVRGFNQNQLGFTLDGVPLGDMSYGNHNGLTSAAQFLPRTSAMPSCPRARAHSRLPRAATSAAPWSSTRSILHTSLA